MFKRRVPLPVVRRLRETLWPRSGWRRAGLYVAHRLGRLPGTPYRIACGFACGAAVSFTPFIGFHFIGAALLAMLLRGNLIASAIGTAVGNPWTFPFIWLWIYNFGHWLQGDSDLYPSPGQLSMESIFQDFGSVFWPMVLGSIPTALVAWFVFYWPARVLVSQYQRTRARRLKKRARKRERRAAAVGLGVQGSEQEG